MPLRPKSWLAKLEACPHGGIDQAELKALGLTPEEVLDFSVCTNPFMPPPGIKEVLNDIPIHQYPDSGANELRQALASCLNIAPEKILAGSGTTELLRLIALTYIRRRDPVLIVGPTYGDYEIAGRIAGAKIIRYRAKEEDNFRPNIKDITKLIKERQPKAVFLCNPNNPTGSYMSRREIETILKSMDGNLLIIDEAYVNFAGEKWSSLDLIARDNVIILRSMTKDYGLSGLRLGYAVAHQEIIGNLRRVCPPWNVNVIAQKAGIAVLKNNEYLEKSLVKLEAAKQFLVDRFTRLGFKVLPSQANYFLMKVGNAREFRASLLQHGILVRDGTSFGTPQYVRIAPRTLPECQKLIQFIKNLSG